MVQAKQSGAILGFIVVGVILVAVLAGGVYFVSHQSAEQPMPETPRQAPVNQPEKKSSQDKPVDVPSKPEGSSDQSTAQLPQTGTTETVGAIIALGLLSGVATSYLRSRRQLASL